MRSIFLVLLTTLSTSSVLARGSTSVQARSERGRANDGPFVCENGRTYEARKGVVYVDGIPALNGVRYEYRRHPGTLTITLFENGFITTHCQPANPPPPPPPPAKWDHYVKVCDPNCRWETRQVQ